MNLNQLNYFVTLAHMEHYTKASESLLITQPSLSHAISTLEQELGTCLFEKQGRNVVLTKYGKLFLKYVEESLAILDMGVKKTKSMTSTTSGVIDLAYIYTLGSEFIPKMVREFLREREELHVQFRFTVGNTSEVIKGLKEERYDIAFCSRKEKESNVIFTPVTREELVVVVPSDHELAEKESVELQKTVMYPHIFFSKSSGLRPVIDKLFHQIKAKPKVAYEVEEDGSVAGLVAEHFGIAVMPDIPVLKTLNVKTIKISKPKYERNIYMAKIKNRYLAPVVQEFVDFVEAKSGDCCLL